MANTSQENPVATAVASAKQEGKFELVNTKEEGSVVKVGGKIQVLNHGTQEVTMFGKTWPPATQEFLKAVYDADKSYSKLVKAPDGYKAPWADATKK